MHRNTYNPKTLVGNWQEDTFDEKYSAKRPRLRSNTDLQWSTTYRDATVHAGKKMNINDPNTERELQKTATSLSRPNQEHKPTQSNELLQNTKSFPGHQPGSHPDYRNAKSLKSHFETTTQATHIDPYVQKTPHQPAPLRMSQKELEEYREKWTKRGMKTYKTENARASKFLRQK